MNKKNGINKQLEEPNSHLFDHDFSASGHPEGINSDSLMLFLSETITEILESEKPSIDKQELLELIAHIKYQNLHILRNKQSRDNIIKKLIEENKELSSRNIELRRSSTQLKKLLNLHKEKIKSLLSDIDVVIDYGFLQHSEHDADFVRSIKKAYRDNQIEKIRLGIFSSVVYEIGKTDTVRQILYFLTEYLPNILPVQKLNIRLYNKKERNKSTITSSSDILLGHVCNFKKFYTADNFEIIEGSTPKKPGLNQNQQSFPINIGGIRLGYYVVDNNVNASRYSDIYPTIFEFINSALTKLLLNEENEHNIFKLSQMSEYDQLTGLANRRFFELELHQQLKIHERQGKELAILFLDLDHFKSVNDNFGHLVGDEALKVFASVLASCIRESDFTARFGGEEFIVLLPDTNMEGALIVANKILAKTREMKIGKLLDKKHPKFSVSIGLHAEVPTDTLACNEFLDKADRALYSAKGSGRDRYHIYCD